MNRDAKANGAGRGAVCPTGSAGFTLLEALISVVIFSVGLLAMVALQSVSKRATHEAVQRTLAAEMVNDLSEQLRLNIVSATPPILSPLTYYVKQHPDGVTLDGDSNFAPLTDPDFCAVADCGLLNSGISQLHDWFSRLAGSSEVRNGAVVGGLVDPTVCVQGPDASGGYAITVVWRGQAKLKNASANACGVGKYGANEEYRRILEARVYVENT